MSEANEANAAGRKGGDALYELRRALDRVAEVSTGVRGDVAEANRVRRRDNAVTIALGAVIVLLLGVALTLTVQNQRLGRQNGELGRQNAEISRQIADCTTAGGDCYRRGQARTGQAITEVVRAQVAIELCGQDPGNDTASEMQECVTGRLDED